MSSVKKNIKIHSVEIKRKASSEVNNKKVKKMKTEEPAPSSSTAPPLPAAAATAAHPPPQPQSSSQPQLEQLYSMPDLYSELEDFLNMELQPLYERNAQMPTMEEELEEQRKEEEEVLQMQKGISELVKKVDIVSGVVDPNFVLPVKKFTADSDENLAQYSVSINGDGSKSLCIGLNPHTKFTPIVQIQQEKKGKIDLRDIDIFFSELENLSSSLVERNNTSKCVDLNMIRFKNGDVTLYSKDCGISLNKKEVSEVLGNQDYIRAKLNVVIYIYSSLYQEYYKLLQNIVSEIIINGKCCVREFLSKNYKDYYYFDLYFELVKKYPIKLGNDIAIVNRFNRKYNKRIA